MYYESANDGSDFPHQVQPEFAVGNLRNLNSREERIALQQFLANILRFDMRDQNQVLAQRFLDRVGAAEDGSFPETIIEFGNGNCIHIIPENDNNNPFLIDTTRFEDCITFVLYDLENQAPEETVVFSEYVLDIDHAIQAILDQNLFLAGPDGGEFFVEPESDDEFGDPAAEDEVSDSEIEADPDDAEDVMPHAIVINDPQLQGDLPGPNLFML